MKIRYVMWKATERCNSRCQMCNIWKQKNIKDSVPERVYSDAWILNITGGEPFLRKDLVKVQEKYFPNVKYIQISTNGLVKNIPDIVAGFKPKVSVTVSVDGESKTHDKIRGIEGAYFKAMDTHIKLRKMGCRSGLQFTLQKDNIDEAFNFLLHHPNTTFNAPVVDGYYNDNKIDFDKNKVIELLNKIIKKDKFRGYYYKHVVQVLQSKREYECLFNDRIATFVDSDGSEKWCLRKNVDCKNCTFLCDSFLHPIYYPWQVIRNVLV